MSIDFGIEGGRRLPVYLLLDCSASMVGAPIQAVNEGVGLLHTELLGTPQALETAWISAIAFSSDAREVVPLTTVEHFVPPTLEAGGITSLGAALALLGELLDRDIVVGSESQKGDWRPLVFLLTDGEPTDDWRPEVEKLAKRTHKAVGTFVAVGCGETVNASTLRALTRNVLLMQDVTPEALKAFFQWVSATISTASVSAQAASRVGSSLPPLPEGLSAVRVPEIEDKPQATFQFGFPLEPVPRQPVYLLVDCSASVADHARQAISERISLLHNELMAQPTAVEIAHISVIKFGGTAEQIVPLTEIANFLLPALSAGGETCLGEALRLLSQSMDRDLVATTADVKGDRRPLVFLFLGSEPTDSWEAEAQIVKSSRWRCTLLALVERERVSQKVLDQLTNYILFLDSVTPDQFQLVEFFRDYDSGPIVTTSSLALRTGPTASEFASPPKDFTIMLDPPVGLERGSEPPDMGGNLTAGDTRSAEELPSPNHPAAEDRRLPVYLLVDCSGSMAGDPIQAVSQGISLLQNELMAQPAALETVYLSVIRFGGTAERIVPLTWIGDFLPPTLYAGGETCLGEALRLLNQSIARDLRPPTDASKGDWGALVFLLLSSEPTDGWEAELQTLKTRSIKKVANIIALACGSEVNPSTLDQITANVVQIDEVTPDMVGTFFKWISLRVTAEEAPASEGGRTSQDAPSARGFTILS